MATVQQIRESLVEDWLAEANSTFYSDTVLLDAINWAYRQIAKQLGGVDARLDTDTTVTVPYEYSLPRNLIRFRQATYNPTSATGADLVSLTPTDQETMWRQAGPNWHYGSSGVPQYLVFMGWYAYALYPRASAVVTNGISIYGRVLPANLVNDSDQAITPRVFDDEIGAGAYLYAMKRLGVQNNKLPQNYQDARDAWNGAIQRAKEFTGAMRPGPRIAGSKPRVSVNAPFPFTWP